LSLTVISNPVFLLFQDIISLPDSTPTKGLLTINNDIFVSIIFGSKDEINRLKLVSILTESG
jgi:hypothetical protein